MWIVRWICSPAGVTNLVCQLCIFFIAAAATDGARTNSSSSLGNTRRFYRCGRSLVLAEHRGASRLIPNQARVTRRPQAVIAGNSPSQNNSIGRRLIGRASSFRSVMRAISATVRVRVNTTIEELACCGGRHVYNRLTHVCCDGATVEAGGPAVRCCGSIAYDSQQYFCREGKVHGFHVDTCAPGRSVIVHLFSWKWTDVALECERFLGPENFCGVQVSPPNEHREILDPVTRPWWERYQPISYMLVSRSGDERQFIDMVRRCNAVGVRIYVDAVINHMAGYGSGTGLGSAGSQYDSHRMDFPGVPFGPSDFNCCNCGRCQTASCDIENYSDSEQVRNCRLVGLLDLDLGKDYVRSKIIEYLNRLVDIGVAGFRVDAVKHMWPGDLEFLYRRVKNLNSSAGFGPGIRPLFFNEVIDLGAEAISSTEYTQLGRITEFRYGRELGRTFRGHTTFEQLRHAIEFEMLPSDRALAFVDNHDNQRGHGAGGADILTFYDGPAYRAAVAFTLAHPYGLVRIMSSYRWNGGPHSNDWIGPPHNSQDPNRTVLDVSIDSSTGQCLGDWVCEHRWPALARMIAWRTAAGARPLHHWWTSPDGRQAAFSRVGAAFIAFNTDRQRSLDSFLHTGLPAGRYCDVATGNRDSSGSRCTGRTVTVGNDGRARIVISPVTMTSAVHSRETDRDWFVAIHIESMLTSRNTSSGNTTSQSNNNSSIIDSLLIPDTSFSNSSFRRTAILIKFHSHVGQYVFLRGGVGHARRQGCSSDARTSRCAIPIRSHQSNVTDDDLEHIGIHLNPQQQEQRRQHRSAAAAWSVGDSKLDWYGPEIPGQAAFHGRQAGGSPAVWTSNDPSNIAAYDPLNKYGPHYWLWDVEMDCNETELDWFEFKAYVIDLSTDAGNNRGIGWEPDVTQAVDCGSKQVGVGRKPFASANHIARCGHVNVFTFGSGECFIEPL